MLNRAVLIVRPKQPFLAWAAQVDDSGLMPNVEGEQTAYLVPEFDDDDEAHRVVKQVFSEIFERELFGWHTDQTAWPKRRSFAVFQQWFAIELHSVVEDLGGSDLVDDEA